MNTLEVLRGDIVRGLYKPGRRLPPQAAICSRFGAGASTVQRVYQSLVEEGFLHVGARRSGTFVVDHPPHLCNYGVVIPNANRWSRFYATFCSTIKSYRGHEAVRFQEYQTPEDAATAGEADLLSEDVLRNRLAGLIVTGHPDAIKGTPAMDQPGLARVALQNNTWPVPFPVVMSDPDSFLDKSVEYLKSKGCRKIAHLCLDYPGRQLEEFEESIRRRGIEVKPYWFQVVPMQSMFRAARKIVNLLMHLEGDRQPDALIIYDDNLIEHAVAGLLAAGVRVPRDLQVIADCNYPSPVQSPLPITMLGLDCRQLIKKCLEVLEQQNRGEKPPKWTGIPVLFEDEVESFTD